MQDFKTYLIKIKGYSDRTVDAYISALDKFNTYKPYQDATNKDVSQYLMLLHSNYVRNIAIASLKLFYKFKIRNGELNYNPMVNVSYTKIQNKTIVPVTSKEMDKIINPKNFHTKEDYILFEILYLTGMRINELHSLSVNEITQDAIKITGKGNKQRIIHLPQYAIQNLLSISNGDKIGSYNYNALRQKMAYYMKDFKRANLTNTTKLSSHGLRHAFATHLHKSGANILSIKEFLGHKTVATTQKYTHLDTDFLKSQHSLMKR